MFYIYLEILAICELMEYFMVMIYFVNKFIDFREKILQYLKYISYFPSSSLFYCPAP